MTTLRHYRDLLKARDHGAVAIMVAAMALALVFEVAMHHGPLGWRWWLACSLLWAVDVSFAVWVWRKAIPDELGK